MKKTERDCYDFDECINNDCSMCGMYEANHQDCDCPDCHEVKNKEAKQEPMIYEGNYGLKIEFSDDGVKTTDYGLSDIECPVFPV